MSAEVQPWVAVQRTGSWRDELFAQYEISQAALRFAIEDSPEPEEFL